MAVMDFFHCTSGISSHVLFHMIPIFNVGLAYEQLSGVMLFRIQTGCLLEDNPFPFMEVEYFTYMYHKSQLNDR